MKSIDQIEVLIARFPAIADEAGSVSGFWTQIDSHMEAIRLIAEFEGTVDELETRYDDLVEMANAAGLVRSEID